MEKTKSAGDKENRPRRDAAYRQAFIDAEAEYPDDAVAQSRLAARITKRAQRKAAAKEASRAAR